jgi:DNA-binding beta-propeller fold protein YncE
VINVWVTDRESDALVAFSAAKLLTKPADSRIAKVNVGQTPVGVTFIRDGTQIMVADANLNNVPGGESGLEPDGTLLVTDNGSGRLQAIDTGSLP